MISSSILLTFVRPHVAPASVLFVGARVAALIGLQQIAISIRATIRIASINRRTAREQRYRLGGAAVVS